MISPSHFVYLPVRRHGYKRHRIVYWQLDHTARAEPRHAHLQKTRKRMRKMQKIHLCQFRFDHTYSLISRLIQLTSHTLQKAQQAAAAAPPPPPVPSPPDDGEESFSEPGEGDEEDDEEDEEGDGREGVVIYDFTREFAYHHKSKNTFDKNDV